MKRLSFILVLTSSTVFAQQWALEDCLQYALSHNLQVKQQELSTQVQKNNLFQSKVDLAPNLNGSLSRNYSFGRAVDAYTNEFTNEKTTTDNYSVNSSVTLFQGFQKINTIRRNELDLRASLLDLEKLKNDIALNVASSYLNVLFNYELLEIAQKQLEMTSQQVDRTQKLVQAGSLAEGDLLEIQSQKANEELQIVNSENQLAMSLLNLKQLLELDSVENFQIVRPMVDASQVNLPGNAIEVFEYAQGHMPEVMSAQYRYEVYQKNLAIARGARSPHLSLGAGVSSGYSDAQKNISGLSYAYAANGGYAVDASGTQLPTYSMMPTYSYSTKPFSDQLKDNRNTYVGLTLSIPILNGWQVNTNISNTKVNMHNAQYSLDLAKKALFKEIQQKYLDAVASYKKLKATEFTVESSRASFEYTRQKYEVGLITSLDYNLSKNKLSKALSDLLQAKYEYIFASKILDFYQGKAIVL